MTAIQPRPTPVRALFESHLTVHDLRRSVNSHIEVVGLAHVLAAPAVSAHLRAPGTPRRRERVHRAAAGTGLVSSASAK
jgi:hypothetical protein